MAREWWPTSFDKWKGAGEAYGWGGTTTLLLGDNQVEMGVLKEGDADDSNCVSAVDFIIVKLSYGKSPGQAGYDGRADFNGDSIVSTPDFTLLKANFNQCGAGPIR